MDRSSNLKKYFLKMALLGLVATFSFGAGAIPNESPAVQPQSSREVVSVDQLPEALTFTPGTDLTIGSPTASLLDRIFHDFGWVRVNTSLTARFRITNSGGGYLPFISSSMSGSYDFSARHTCRPGLNPGESCYIDIQFWPSREGHAYSTVRMDFQGDSVLIEVRGYGRW